MKLQTKFRLRAALETLAIFVSLTAFWWWAIVMGTRHWHHGN